ncbi:hypothetical protein J7E88_06585 [Streptomyces sp. ISL-10]|uniref:hypothetical protein n=1 Tax=Streptomyces sp. ISL-10 TaxID=2819172 RepID=UPI001BE96ABC|nr:hypothetical protein [Streptomyces sp. ISL-10]MBT2364994.1 hypothetical protein [Streptomyces sp. ISL-10]
MANTGQETGSYDAGIPETADREFASALEHLGIEMPPDLAPGVLAGYRSLRAMTDLLRTVEITDV